MEVDTQSTVTETGTNSGNPGSGAPQDAPAVTSAKRYTQEEFDTASAKTRRAVTAEVSAKAEKALLERLGMSSIDDLADRLAKSDQPKPKKSEAEQIAEKIEADYKTKLEKAEARAQAAEAKEQAAEAQRSAERVRAFLHQHVANTTSPTLAMALFGVFPQPERVIREVNGKITVVDSDGTELPHIDPVQFIKETLSGAEHLHLQKPAGVGSGGRTGAAPVTTSESKPKNSTEMRAAIKKQVASHFGGRSGANGVR